MLVESAPTMTVALAPMLVIVLVMMPFQNRAGILADYENCSLTSAQAKIGAEMLVHSVHVVDAANAQALIGEEMVVHEFPTLSRAELHQ